MSRSQWENVDIDYTFVQVLVGSKNVDMTGNCGNMASGVDPFALDEGLVTAPPGQKEVRQHASVICNSSHTLVDSLSLDSEER